MQRIRNTIYNIRVYVCVGLVALALGIIGTGIYSYYFIAPPVAKIEKVFLDVNSDGNLDYLVYGEVILNTGDVPFLADQQ
jgi:uncharacterized membrane protein YukC